MNESQHKKSLFTKCAHHDGRQNAIKIIDKCTPEARMSYF